MDSDGDGCPDALEAAGSFNSNHIDGDWELTGGVDGNGIPNVVSPGGQGLAAAVTDNSVRSGCPSTIITNRRITYRVRPN